VGTVAGVLLVEWRRNGEWQTAIGATKGYIAGTAVGIMARVTSGLLMLVIFLSSVSMGS